MDELLEFVERSWNILGSYLIMVKGLPNLGSISSTFYEQLLREQIPNAQKRQSSHQCLPGPFGPECVKAACKMLMKLKPGGNGFDDGLAPVQRCLLHGRDQGRVTLMSIIPIVMRDAPKRLAILEVKTFFFQTTKTV